MCPVLTSYDELSKKTYIVVFNKMICIQRVYYSPENWNDNDSGDFFGETSFFSVLHYGGHCSFQHAWFPGIFDIIDAYTLLTLRLTLHEFLLQVSSSPQVPGGISHGRSLGQMGRSSRLEWHLTYLPHPFSLSLVKSLSSLPWYY